MTDVLVNPTAANGVDSSNLAHGVPGIRRCMEELPSVELQASVCTRERVGKQG